jgi:hypothetical protein
MKIRELPSTIANGAATGSAVNVAAGTDPGMALCAVYVPASFNQTAMAFEGSMDGTTWFDVLKEDGTDYSVTVAAGKATVLDITKLCGFSRIRPVMGGNVNADYTVTFIAREV